MAFETWIAFAGASAVLLVIPGPTVILVASYALGQGWRAALPMALGVALGDFTAMTVSMLGLGALLASSATVFAVLKWVGAAYLIWLGVRLWRTPAAGRIEARRGARPALRMIGHAWLVTALNPKSIVFFVAFLPQFLDPSLPLLPQLAIFQATFLVMAFANAFGYAALAARAQGLVESPRAQAAVARVGGATLIGAGLAAAAARQA